MEVSCSASSCNGSHGCDGFNTILDFPRDCACAQSLLGHVGDVYESMTLEWLYNHPTPYAFYVPRDNCVCNTFLYFEAMTEHIQEAKSAHISGSFQMKPVLIDILAFHFDTVLLLFDSQ